MKIKESIKPFIFFPHLILCFVLAYLTATATRGNLFYGVFIVACSWQLGWGMKITKVIGDESKNK